MKAIKTIINIKAIIKAINWKRIKFAAKYMTIGLKFKFIREYSFDIAPFNIRRCAGKLFYIYSFYDEGTSYKSYFFLNFRFTIGAD